MKMRGGGKEGKEKREGKKESAFFKSLAGKENSK